MAEPSASSSSTSAASAKALMELANRVSLGELLHDQRDASTVDASASLLGGLRALRETGFHSLPVVSAAQGGKPVGVLNRFDVLRAVVRAVYTAGDAGARAPDAVRAGSEAASAAVHDALAATAGAAAAAGEQPDVEQLWQYPAEARMAKALELFGLGVRHLVVTGPFPASAGEGAAEDAAEEKAAQGDESTLRVLSQIDFVQGLLNVYLSNRLRNLDDHATVSAVFAQTAGAVKGVAEDGSPLDGGKPSPVLTVGETESVLAALLHLVENGYNAAPVVDAEGRVVGAIGSEAVLRLVGADDKLDLSFLDEPVSTLLRGRAKAVTCSPKADLAQVANKMLDEHAHRVWVTVDQKPVAVLSCSDVIFAVGGEDAVMEDAAAQ